MIARSLRYYVEGVLAVFYGRLVLRVLREYGLTILGVVAVPCLVGLALYFLTKRLRGRGRAATVEKVEPVGSVEAPKSPAS
jgi:hypothetical protein